jgi:hypothetical protein
MVMAQALRPVIAWQARADPGRAGEADLVDLVADRAEGSAVDQVVDSVVARAVEVGSAVPVDGRACAVQVDVLVDLAVRGGRTGRRGQARGRSATRDATTVACIWATRDSV